MISQAAGVAVIEEKMQCPVEKEFSQSAENSVVRITAAAITNLTSSLINPVEIISEIKKENEFDSITRIEEIAQLKMAENSAPLLTFSEEEQAWFKMPISEFISSQTREKVEQQICKYIEDEDRKELLNFAGTLFAVAQMCTGPFSELRDRRSTATLSELGEYIINTYDRFKTDVLLPKCYTLTSPVWRRLYSEYIHIRNKKEGKIEILSAQQVADLIIDKFNMEQLPLAYHYLPEDFALVLGGEDSAEPRVPFTADPDLEVTITHGGGYSYISKFLRGDSPGYKLEKPARTFNTRLGIQVHPHIAARERLVFYANRAAKENLDKPCILTARIKACFLTKAYNRDEAGLEPQYLRHLKDIHLEILEYNGC